MATTDVAQNSPGTTSAPKATEAKACAACAHPWDAHDVIGMRFCTATISGALNRGCACGR